MIPPSVEIEIENGRYLFLFGEKSFFLGHISLNQETDFDIQPLPGMSYSLLALL